MRNAIYTISAGRLWSIVLTIMILVELAIVIAIFLNQNPTWLIIVHRAYVMATLLWLAYAAYTIKALGRRVKMKG